MTDLERILLATLKECIDALQHATGLNSDQRRRLRRAWARIEQAIAAEDETKGAP